MTFGYDPEVPAGYQDADIEMREYEDIANEAMAEAEANAEPPPETIMFDKMTAEGWEKCPRCNSGQIEGGSIEIESIHAWQRVSCLSCHTHWVEVYTAFIREQIGG